MSKLLSKEQHLQLKPNMAEHVERNDVPYFHREIHTRYTHFIKAKCEEVTYKTLDK